MKRGVPSVSSYIITKEEIIKKFGIKVGPDEDTWSYYRNDVLEIKIVPKEVGPTGKEENEDEKTKGR